MRASARFGGVPRPIPSELTRAALLARLEDSQVQLVVLAAPSGYGKTTLLAQYARNAGHACVWLSLSADDADPRTLLASVLKALEAHGVSAPAARGALERGAVGEALARALAADLATHEARLELIFDGVERVGAVSGRWLTALAEHAAPHNRVLLSGFDIAELGLARLLARGTAAVIGVDALRFSVDEGVAYLRARGYDGDALEAFRGCDGWPVGLGLIGAGADVHLTPEDLVLDALEGLAPDLRETLNELAVFEIWEDAAGVALQPALRPGWLGAVRRAGLPLTPLGGGAFRPHTTLRQALERRLKRDPERFARAHRTAALRAEARGASLQAVEHYALAGDEAAAFALVRQLCEPLLTASEYELLRQLLERFGPDRLPDDLCAMLGAAWLEVGEGARGLALLRALLERGAATPLVHYVLGKEAARRGDYRAELAHADAGLMLEPKDAGWRACERLKGWALLDLERLEEARGYALALVARTDEHSADKHSAVHDLGASLLLAHNAHRALGELDASERLLHRALEIYAALDAPARVAMIRNELADLLRERGDVARAQALLEPALLDTSALPGEVAAHLLETQGDLQLARGDGTSALEAWRAARDLCARHRLEVLRARIEGKLSAAREPAPVPHATGLELRITSFGERRVTIAGQPVAVSLSKSFELLTFLALRGPSTREAIMDALWDGSREARHQEYFKVAVRKLRAALSAAPFVNFNPVPLGNRYALAAEFQVHLDAHALEHPHEASPQTFRGAFLEGIETPWASDLRERYQTQLEDALLGWGAAARAHDPARAVELYTNGLAHHPLSEALLLALVGLHCELGQHTAALAAFTRFKITLRADLGVEPDAHLTRSLLQVGLRVAGDSLAVPSAHAYSGA
jgi:DNA-binding SARP family transcriptional activator